MDEFDEIIENGLLAADNIMNLLKTAMNSSTTHEKDKLIHQIKKLYNVENESMAAVEANNEQKSKILEQLQKKVDAVTEQYNTFDTNTSFIHELARDPPNMKSELIEQIHEVEQAIIEIKPLASPKSLAQVTQLSPEQDLFQLKTRDLLFTRLEELTYALKKRILVVEDSTNSSIAVIEKYGNVSGLINHHNQLLEENEILKYEESYFLYDAMAKRRNLNAISPTLLTNISMVMQDELTELMNYGYNLVKPVHLETNFAPFDEVCDIPRSIEYNQTDFGTNIDQELINLVVQETNPPRLLQLMRYVIDQQQTTINKLLYELEPLRSANYKDTSENIERLQKLWTVNERFSNQIREISDSIENTNNEIRKLNYTIKRLIKQRGYYDEMFCDTQKKLVPLTNETIALTEINNKNKEIFRTLGNICYNFGLSLLNTDSQNYSSLKDLILDRIPPPPPVHKVVEPPPPPPPVEEEPEKPANSQHPDDPRKFFMIKPTMSKRPPIRRKTLPTAETSQSSLTSSLKELPERKKPLSITNSDRVELLDYIALTHEITQSVERKEPIFHGELNKNLQECLDSLRSNLTSAKAEFVEEIMTRINSIKECSHAILCRPKTDVETSVCTCPTVEIEIQTEDPPDPKAKGKKPARKK